MSVSFTDVSSGVAALLDLASIDASSTPTISQVSQWLYDATVAMCQLLPDDKLTNFENNRSASDVGEFTDLSLIEVIRVASASKYGRACTRITRTQMNRIRRMGLLTFDTSSPAYTPVSSTSGNGLSLQFYPTTPGTVDMKLICYPSFDPTQWGSSMPNCPPKSWTALLVEYVVMKAKYQDEELEQSEAAYKQWAEKVQMVLGGESIGGRQ